MPWISTALKSLAFGAVLCASFLGTAKADILAVNYSATCFCAGTTFGGTYGWEFTVSSTIGVTELGVLQYGFQHLATSHEVTIWNWNTQVEMADATVPTTGATSVTAGGVGDTWQMVELPSTVYLDPGTYVIGAFYPETPADSLDFGSNPSNGLVQNLPQVVQWIHERDTAPIPSGDSAMMLPTHSVFSGGVFGPNFEFTTPEPSSLTLAIGAFAIGLASALKRRFGRPASVTVR
jgi:hypothetical protein